MWMLDRNVYFISVRSVWVWSRVSRIYIKFDEKKIEGYQQKHEFQ